MKTTPNRGRPVRTRAVLAQVVVLTTLSLFVGTASGNPTPVEGHFGPGELMTYELRYGIFRTGSARILVGGATALDGREVWPIVTDYRTSEEISWVFELQERFITHWDPQAKHSRGFDHYSRTRGNQFAIRARPHSGTMVMREVRPNKKPSEWTRNTKEVKHDFASAIFWLRQRPLENGDVEKISIFTGSKSIALEARVVGRESLEMAGRRWETVKVNLRVEFDGKFKPKRDLQIWYSDDAAHIPLRFEADLALGSLGAELQRYAPGSRL